MIRTLTTGDEAALERFLAGRAESSMFLRSNLRQGGIVDRGERLQGTWVGAFDGGELVGVASHNWNGILLLQAPDRLEALVRAAPAASGRPVAGLLGPWGQVEAARAALGLREAPTSLDSREDLFSLELADLRVPPPLADGRWTVRRATGSDAALLIDWRTAYEIEAVHRPPGDETRRIAEAGVRNGIGAGHQWVLEVDGRPVATSTFNATLPDTVQIGGVWTPPELRGNGYARAVVAGSLTHAARDGVSRSVLFTGEHNEPARRAYLAIGYRIVGDYGIVLFADPHAV